MQLNGNMIIKIVCTLALLYKKNALGVDVIFKDVIRG